MMASPLDRVARREAPGAGVRVSELRNLQLFLVSDLSRDNALESSGCTKMTVGPGRYLASGEGAAEAFADVAGQEHLTVQDVSHARTVLVLAGDAVRDLMSKVCAIDLHPAVFPKGAYAVTPVAGIEAVIRCVDEDRFELYVVRSFARHVLEAIIHRGAEYGVAWSG